MKIKYVSGIKKTVLVEPSTINGLRQFDVGIAIII